MYVLDYLNYMRLSIKLLQCHQMQLAVAKAAPNYVLKMYPNRALTNIVEVGLEFRESFQFQQYLSVT